MGFLGVWDGGGARVVVVGKHFEGGRHVLLGAADNGNRAHFCSVLFHQQGLALAVIAEMNKSVYINPQK